MDQSRQKSSLGIVDELIVAKQHNKISFGVSILTKRYYSVLYNMTSITDKEAASYKGLFYNMGDQVIGASYLIVDNFMLKEEDTVRMLMGQEVIHLLLKNKKNIGLGYWQFECQRVAAKHDTIQVKKGYDFI